MVISTTTSTTVTSWAERIRPHLSQAVESIVAAGVELNAAKALLPHGEFGPLLEELGLSRQMANRFMRVASNPVLSKCSPVGGLPAAVSVLDVLVRMPDDELATAIESGEITASTTRKDAIRLVNRCQRDVGPDAEQLAGVTIGEINGQPIIYCPPDVGSVGKLDGQTAEISPAARMQAAVGLIELHNHEVAIRLAIDLLAEALHPVIGRRATSEELFALIDVRAPGPPSVDEVLARFGVCIEGVAI